MKPVSPRTLTQTVAACAAPLLTFSTATAEVLSYNEANATNVWTLPAGTNLLDGATASPATATTHEGSSSSWATLTDGILGAPGDNAATVTPNNGESVTFPLDVLAQPGGYDLTTFDAYCTWANSGRSNMNFTLQYSTVEDPATFFTIAVVNNVDSPTNRSTHTCITDTTGVLASGVHSVKVLFGSPVGQENGYVGYSEFKLSATPTNVETLIESNTGNVWTLPAGTNLLNGTNAVPATAATNEGSSPNWSTVTDGLLGTAASIASSVTPPNNSSVVFPLDLSVNFNGYRLSSIDTYCAWPNSGRDNQTVMISYSTVADPATFIRLGHAVVNTTSDNATHARLTPAAGFLANNVAAVRFDFGHQENGFVGYREFIALGAAEPLVDPLTWTGGSGAGGNASWIAGPDSNWKTTIGGTAANFDPLAELTFDSTGANRNITVPAALTASSLAFTHTDGTPYTLGGELLTVSNGITSTGSGSATFNNTVQAATGVTLAGDGTLAFNAAVQGTGATVSGSGELVLNAANPALTGNASVSNGTLTVSHNLALQNAALVTTGGVTRFVSAAPQIASLAGTFGSSVTLGNGSGPVNTTLSVGDAGSVTLFDGVISDAAGATGSLTKTGTSLLTLSGANTYSGTTTVAGGILELTRREALYNANTAAWTAGNIVAGDGGTLLLKVGTFDEFLDTDVNADLPLGGFQPGSALGIGIDQDLTLTRDLVQPGMGLYKTGPAVLTLTGSNTADGLLTVIAGVVNAASPATAIAGDVLLGNASAEVFLNFGGNDQLGADTVISAANGTFYQTKINLRGTSQTVAGLDAAPFPANRVTLVQGDEIGQPGYAGVPGPSTLTIDATASHSFTGLIRNGDGGDTVSVIKEGPGTQEFRNLSGIQGYGYNGPTTINDGTLRLNFAGTNTDFASDITVNAPGTLEFDGTFTFSRTLAGEGDIVKTGAGTVIWSNAAFTHTGTTRVDAGVLQVDAPSLADGATVVIDDDATLHLPHADTDTIAALTLGLDDMADGIYAAEGNGGPGITETPRITGTGKLFVSSGSPVVTYETWSLVIPDEAERDRADDADGDGFSNLEEFLFGTSPVANTGALVGIENTGSGLIVRWNQRATGSSTYVLQESTTLVAPWDVSGAVITDAAVQDLPDYVKKEAVIPLAGPLKFVRVEATE